MRGGRRGEETTVFEGLVFTVADAAQRTQVLDLRRTIYTEELGHHGIDEFDDAAYHLIACDTAGTILAALRIVGPEQRPFDLEQFVDLDELLAPDRVPGEISRFCIRRDRRRVRSDFMIQAGMLKLTHAFARKHGLTDFVTLALPHLRNLYRVAFFQPLSPAFEHPMWGKVYPMHLDLSDLEARHAHSTEPMAQLLFGPDLPNIVV